MTHFYMFLTLKHFVYLFIKTVEKIVPFLFCALGHDKAALSVHKQFTGTSQRSLLIWAAIKIQCSDWSIVGKLRYRVKIFAP